MAEIIFERTCNYWIDAGIVGLYDTLNKPVSDTHSIGGWSETIKKRANVLLDLKTAYFKIEGEERAIDLALSFALERIRKTLYDVSTEKQIASPEKDGRIKQMSTLAGDLIASGKQADYTYFRKEIIKNIGTKNIFLPLKLKKTKKVANCVFCGNPINESLALNKANEVFVGDTLKSSPFVEGSNSNKCFHSYHKGSEKCWRCGYVTFFAPLLLFYHRKTIDRDKKDTYYVLPYIPANLEATFRLYRSLSGKRGLSRVTGTEHIIFNYESFFKIIPRGIPAFTLSFYYDLCERLLPKNTTRLLKTSKEVGLIDDRGILFQTALFLKRDSGQKSFILRETTIDRSAYFIKLFGYLKKQLDNSGNGKLLSGLRAVINRSMDKRSQLQRLSVIKASQALTEGRHVFRFLLPILSSDLKEDTARPNEVPMIIDMFQKYDQWLFKSEKEDKDMENIVEQARNAGWHLSQEFWKKPEWKKLDDKEKESLLRRYYYSIERAPSPVKFLEQVRHAFKKVDKEVPKEMSFHHADCKEDMKTFEVYRVYFLAGMLNGLINRGKKTQDATEQTNNEEVESNE